jgi:putative oxidoreductase
MSRVGLFFARVVLGGYFTVHGAQKLFGWFGGPGLEATSTGFEALGIPSPKRMATLAGASQLVGGVLTITKVIDPLGPLVIAGNMVVATAVLRKRGPMSKGGGFELPLVYAALAIALVSSGTRSHGSGQNDRSR